MARRADGTGGPEADGSVRWELGNVDGMRVCVQVDDTGDRHIELFAADEAHPAAVLIFDPQQARRLAAALHEGLPLRP